MSSNSNQDQLISCAQSLIKRKTWSLIGRYGFTSSDLEDLKQDLMCDFLCRVERFDPAQGTEIQFVSTVVRHGIASIVGRKKKVKRGWGVIHVSLEKELRSQNDKVTNPHDTFDKESYLGLTRGPTDPRLDRLEAQIDLERIKKDIHPDQCELLTILMTHTPSEAARELGIPRTTLNSRVSNLLSRLRKTKWWG